MDEGWGGAGKRSGGERQAVKVVAVVLVVVCTV